MERLTKRISKTIQDKYSLGSYLCYDFAKADDINKLLNKLGEFEDFMEEVGAESLDELEGCIVDLNKENQVLKDRWEKLKEIISNKQHIKDKATDFVTLLGASGVEVFCEMLLKEMEKLEQELKKNN